MTTHKIYDNNNACTLAEMRDHNNAWAERLDRGGRWFGKEEMRMFGTLIDGEADCFGLFIARHRPDHEYWHLHQILPSGRVDTITPSGGVSEVEVRQIYDQITDTLADVTEKTIADVTEGDPASRCHFYDAVFARTKTDALVQFQRSRTGIADGDSEDGAICYKGALVAYTAHV